MNERDREKYERYKKYALICGFLMVAINIIPLGIAIQQENYVAAVIPNGLFFALGCVVLAKRGDLAGAGI